MSVVVEPQHPFPEPPRKQDVERDPPVATGPDDSDTYLLVEA
ncbi:MAG TPA: hypothetical protein VIZ60_08650 [Rubrobacter sp.]|jgi:hypothetical protein